MDSLPKMISLMADSYGQSVSTPLGWKTRYPQKWHPKLIGLVRVRP
jgi:hypothetical protein